MIYFPYTTGKHHNFVNEFSFNEILDIKPKTFYDIGIGDGFWGRNVKYLLKDNVSIIGVEPNNRWAYYSYQLGCYDKIYIRDIKDIISGIRGDMIMFGDILEHLDYDDFKYVLSISVENFRYIIINCPLGFVYQDHEDIWEHHKCGINYSDLYSYNIIEYHQKFQNDVGFSMINCLIKGYG